MNVKSLFTNEHKVNIVFFVVSYMATVFSLSLITVVTVIIINYINRDSLVFDIGFAIKTIKMLSIAGLFAFTWSAVTTYNDRKKCINVALGLMNQYNTFNINSDSGEEAGSIRNAIIKMDLGRNFYGLMAGLIVNDVDTRVKGINVKEMNYYLSCEVKYKTGEKDRFKLKFSAINGADPVLKSIIF